MGYSISQETHQRIERHRREDRWCQGSGRCSNRATRVIVIESPTRDPQRYTHVCCKKHTDELQLSYEYYGVLFANETGSKIVMTYRISPGDHGTQAREIALGMANFLHPVMP